MIAAVDPVARTAALADALGLSIDLDAARAILDPAAGGIWSELVEWSVNGGDDPRALLRFGAWTGPDDARLRGVFSLYAGPAARALRDAMPHDGMEGIGLAFTPDDTRLRWWQLAGPSRTEAEALHAAARDAIGADLDAIAAECGGPARCAAVGGELAPDGGLMRATAYYRVLRPESALALLERIEAPSSTAGKQLLAGLCGLDGRFGLPWPKVWVGRSLDHGKARGGGYKLYVFLRGADRRPSDAALLDLAGGDALRRAHRAFGGPECAIPIVGLTWADDVRRPPRWTIYLADR